jgi:hypothetical protein
MTDLKSCLSQRYARPAGSSPIIWSRGPRDADETVTRLTAVLDSQDVAAPSNGSKGAAHRQEARFKEKEAKAAAKRRRK